MKIGIFLGYGPQVKLGKEGLGRYVGGLVKGFQEQNHEVTIACPFWLKDTVFELLDTFSIDKSKVNLITTHSNPPLWKIYNIFYKKRKIKREKIKRILVIKNFFDRILKNIGGSNSFFEMFFWGIILFLFFIAIFIPVLFFCIFYFIYLFKKNYKKLIKIETSSKSNKFFKKIKDKIFFGDDIKLQIFYNMYDSVLNKLVNIINNNTKVDVWFIPAIFWPQVNYIKGTVVINAPDLVSQEFPFGFTDVYGSDVAIKRCRETLLNGKYFITYCEFLRKNLLIEQYSKEPINTVSIRHANNDMAPYITIDKNLTKNLMPENEWSDIFAREIIKVYVEPNVRYIFYASQIRPSKNMLNLVKAYEILLREKFITHKLYVTADLEKETEVSEYIKKHRLENDIISIYNVPAQTLAALYHCADLVVNPTLYEGGFPFTFGEGMSVGTPSIMSDIPQVREVLEVEGLKDIMFDPFDIHSIADKIEWALSNLNDLYKKELVLYKKMSQRSYSLVAKEYVNALQKFIEYDKQNHSEIYR